MWILSWKSLKKFICEREGYEGYRFTEKSISNLSMYIVLWSWKEWHCLITILIMLIMGKAQSPGHRWRALCHNEEQVLYHSGSQRVGLRLATSSLQIFDRNPEGGDQQWAISLTLQVIQRHAQVWELLIYCTKTAEWQDEDCAARFVFGEWKLRDFPLNGSNFLSSEGVTIK